MEFSSTALSPSHVRNAAAIVPRVTLFTLNGSSVKPLKPVKSFKPFQLSWKTSFSESASGSPFVTPVTETTKTCKKLILSFSAETATKTAKKGFGGKKGGGEGEREKPGGGRGFGSGSSAKNVGKGLDGPTLLRLSRKEWGKLQEEDKSRHYVVSIKKKKGTFSHFLPVAYLSLLSKEEGSEAVKKALPYLTREILECAKLYSSLFDSCRWNDLEYAFEREDNFAKKDKVKRFMESDGAPPKGGREEEREECPYEVLGLEAGASSSEVRSAYRSMAATYHPDRHQNTPEAEEKFKKVVGAYDRIKQMAGGENMVGGSTDSIENLIEVEIKEPINGYKMPQGLKAGIVPVDFNLTDLFLQDKRFKSVNV